MTDKPGLICPECGEVLATFADDISVRGTMLCLKCGRKFPFAIMPSSYVGTIMVEIVDDGQGDSDKG